jgi:hypothetical protein
MERKEVDNGWELWSTSKFPKKEKKTIPKNLIFTNPFNPEAQDKRKNLEKKSQL